MTTEIAGFIGGQVYQLTSVMAEISSLARGYVHKRDVIHVLRSIINHMTGTYRRCDNIYEAGLLSDIP